MAFDRVTTTDISALPAPKGLVKIPQVLLELIAYRLCLLATLGLLLRLIA